MRGYTGELHITPEVVEKETRRREHEKARTGITENEFRIRKGLGELAPMPHSIKNQTMLDSFENPTVQAHLEETEWTSGKTDWSVFLQVGCGDEEIFTFNNLPDAMEFLTLARLGS